MATFVLVHGAWGGGWEWRWVRDGLRSRIAAAAGVPWGGDKELRDRGVVFEDYDMPGLKTVDGIAEIQGVKGGWFKDPDGNILAVAERT